MTTRKARLAVTVHDMLPFEPDLPGVNGRWHPRSWLRWRVTMRRILRRAHLIATVSEYTRRRMLSLFDVPRPERIVVVGNGVSAAFFRTPQPEDAETLARYELAERPYVVVPGSLTGRKGADRVLQLACRLKREGSDVLLLVVGRRHEPQCLAMFDELQRAEGPLPVRLAGFVPDDDLACLLSHALALFFPSRYEGFGIPALEAMAAGTPVVASRAGALADTVAGAGIFVSGADIDEALAALRELSRCEAARAELIAAGRRRAARFTWPRCAARLIEAMATA